MGEWDGFYDYWNDYGYGDYDFGGSMPDDWDWGGGDDGDTGWPDWDWGDTPAGGDDVPWWLEGGVPGEGGDEGEYGEYGDGIVTFTDAEGTHYYDPYTQDWTLDTPSPGEGMYGTNPDGQYFYVDQFGNTRTYDEATGNWVDVEPTKGTGLTDIGLHPGQDGILRGPDGKPVTGKGGKPISAAPPPATKKPGGSSGSGSSGSGSPLGDSLKGGAKALGGALGGTAYTKGQTKNKATYLGDLGQIQEGSPFADILKEYQGAGDKYGGLFDDILYGEGYEAPTPATPDTSGPVKPERPEVEPPGPQVPGAAPLESDSPEGMGDDPNMIAAVDGFGEGEMPETWTGPDGVVWDYDGTRFVPRNEAPQPAGTGLPGGPVSMPAPGGSAFSRAGDEAETGEGDPPPPGAEPPPVPSGGGRVSMPVPPGGTVSLPADTDPDANPDGNSGVSPPPAGAEPPPTPVGSGGHKVAGPGWSPGTSSGGTASSGGGLLALLNEFANNPEGKYDTEAGDVFRRLASGDLMPEEILANKAFAEMAEGPTADERALYEKTGRYGETSGEDESRLRQMAREYYESEGYDEATKRALTGLALETAAMPFSVARERASRLGLSTNNPLVSAVAETGTARDSARAVTEAGRKNIIDIFNEKERQKELGTGLTKAVSDIANQRQQFGLGSQAGQLGQWAKQKATGAGGLQAGAGLRTGRMATGASGLGQLGQNLFGRRTAGAQGLMTLAALAAAQEKANRDARAGIYGKKREDYTESAGTRIGG